jgi:hypothetical protein
VPRRSRDGSRCSALRSDHTLAGLTPSPKTAQALTAQARTMRASGTFSGSCAATRTVVRSDRSLIL